MTTKGRRSGAVGLVVVAAAAVLTSCSVPADSWTGLTVNRLGQLQVVLRPCTGYLDALELYDDRSRVTGWTRSSRLGTELETFTLAGENALDQWTAASIWSGPDDGRTYHLYGATTDDYWSALAVDFTVANVGALRSGEVVFSNSDSDGHRSVPVDDFAAMECDPPP